MEIRAIPLKILLIPITLSHGGDDGWFGVWDPKNTRGVLLFTYETMESPTSLLRYLPATRWEKNIQPYTIHFPPQQKKAKKRSHPKTVRKLPCFSEFLHLFIGERHLKVKGRPARWFAMSSFVQSAFSL